MADVSGETKLKLFIEQNAVVCEHLIFAESCHSVREAAHAAKASADDFVKSLCFIAPDGSLIVAILLGSDKVDVTKLAALAKVPVIRIAQSSEVLAKTGYPAGGVPAFGYPAKVFVDEQVLTKKVVYCGGGSDHSLVRISPQEILVQNGGILAQVHISPTLNKGTEKK